MGIDRGGPCDTGESVDSWLASNKAAERERNLQKELQLTEEEVSNLKGSVVTVRKLQADGYKFISDIPSEAWLKNIEKLIHDWKLMREKF